MRYRRHGLSASGVRSEASATMLGIAPDMVALSLDINGI
jgi:hypothetical protein